MEDQLTLFNQYESEYCNKSTDVARKIDTLSTLVGGLPLHPTSSKLCARSQTRDAVKYQTWNMKFEKLNKLCAC